MPLTHKGRGGAVSGAQASCKATVKVIVHEDGSQRYDAAETIRNIYNRQHFEEFKKIIKSEASGERKVSERVQSERDESSKVAASR